MKTWVIKIGTSILRGTEETSTEEVIETLCNSFKNASKTLKKLIDLNVIPIVNENDTVANEELKYGDNDTLSALVALAINANKLFY